MKDIAKQVIVVRKDLNMSVGKTASQVAHASMKAIFQLGDISPNEDSQDVFTLWVDRNTALESWFFGPFTKVVLYVESEKELMELYQKVQNDGLNVSVIKDCGKTEFDGVSTFTCIAIGPDYSSVIDKYTGNLKLLK